MKKPRRLYIIILIVVCSVRSEETSPSWSGEQQETSETKKWCDYEIDNYNCLNINCNGVRRVTKIPESIHDLVMNFTEPKPSDQNGRFLLCSIDLSETGITELRSETFQNFDMFLFDLVKNNPNQTLTNIKLHLSHIEEIRQFKLPIYLNNVLIIRDSSVRYVQPKALSLNNKLEINLISEC